MERTNMSMGLTPGQVLDKHLDDLANVMQGHKGGGVTAILSN